MIDFSPLSLSSYKLEAYDKRLISSATAFIYKYEGTNYLITNYHVITGKDYITEKYIDINCRYPTKIKIQNHTSSFEIDLFDEEHNAVWYEHPKYGSKFDAVAIPIDDMNMKAVNDIKLQNVIYGVGSEVFIIGYPYGININNTPIWKNGSIASEPNINIENIPKFYIDAATRQGLSGSPVMIMEKIYYTEEKSFFANGTFGIRFLGIYSGRIVFTEDKKTETNEEKDQDLLFKATIGVVFKEEGILEIIESKKRSEDKL